MATTLNNFYQVLASADVDEAKGQGASPKPGQLPIPLPQWNGVEVELDGWALPPNRVCVFDKDEWEKLHPERWPGT